MMHNIPLALRFPLNGSQLIEASAGTGKTFTISALYLRLVLGHGSEGMGFGRELLPPQILVVTFTDAATKELRDRIRTRLAEAARFFRDEITRPDAIDRQLRGRIRHLSNGPVAPAVSTSPRSGWTKRRYPPFTVGASACCASTPSTAVACSPRAWKPITAICSSEVLRDYWRNCSVTRCRVTRCIWVREQLGRPCGVAAKGARAVRQ